MRTSFFVAVFTLIGACKGSFGSGVEVSQPREVGAFKRVSIGSGFEAVVTPGSRAVSVKGDDNLLELVETFVDGETFVARLHEGSMALPSRPIEVTILNDVLQGVSASGAAKVVATATPVDEFIVSASGAADIEVTGISSTRLVVGASGASKVSLSGAANVGAVTASGASRVDTRGVPLQTATLDVSGGSIVHAAVSSSVAGSASGGSSVILTGDPSGDVSATGGSRVSRGAH